ncbi:ATP-binding protein [Marinomonas algarum]|uniref:histidine kinase n=1 Tax=Marinomonas algarum TaxID=2883105 RepID=A0A9X1IKF9_9GAMM|nr:ATP-binding protein [Marinomonas algarum]MCB5161169.1 sensor histidine kinase N-terminal domain-containing protein [Marinomonas algarum]
MWLTKKWGEKVALNSIKRRTLFIVMSVFTLVSLLVMVIGLVFANHEVEELFDARLAQQARLLLVLSDNISHEDHHTTRTLLKDITNTDQSVGHKYESKIFYQLWNADQLSASSSPLTLTPQKSDEAGYSVANADGYEWRVFTLHQIHGDKKVVVAERADIRGEIAQQIVIQTLMPELLGWPIVAIFVSLAVGLGLAPLRQLASKITQLTPEKLEPIYLPITTKELTPVQNALNHLLTEVDVLMEREKRFIADATHELRTPLSILKIHAQNALTADNDLEQRHSLEQLVKGVDRSTRIVSQLLVLARLEHQKHPIKAHSADFLVLTRAIIADILPLAWKKNIEITLDADEESAWNSLMDSSHIEILLQNLLSNSLKFSPDHSVIQVRLSQHANIIQLSVVDNGHGVTEEQRQRLSERFYRSSKIEGVGLGLSIVKNIVDKYHGTLEYRDSPQQGLTVNVMLPTL